MEGRERDGLGDVKMLSPTFFHEMRVDSGFDFGDSGRSRPGISLGSGCKV